MRLETETIAKLVEGLKVEKKSLPLRLWYAQRGLPIEIKIGSYTIHQTTHRKKVKVNRIAIWGKMETLDEFQKRKRHKKSKIWCKGSKGSNRRTFEWKEENSYVWIKLISKWNCGDASNRKMIFDGKYLRLTLFSNEIGIWYISSEGQIRFWILPDEIEINDELLQVVGILDGEAHKKPRKKGGMSTKVTNSESIIIKKVIEIFKAHFKISEESWRASLTINAKKLKEKYSEEEDKKLKEFWSKSTGIPIENFGKTTLLFQYESKHSPHGILQIRVSSFLLWKFLMKFLEYLRDIINTQELIVPYLQGLVAAEGGVGLKKNGSISHLLIGSTKDSDKKFYMKCLDILEIKSKEYEQRIEICGSKNWLKFLEFDLFKLHPNRKMKFITAIDKMKIIKKKIDLLHLTLHNSNWN